jgi:hypothetical protein
MNIISIDVGMKNLAFCVFAVNDKSYDILDWGVEDLCNSETKKQCMFVTKGKCCTRGSKYNKDGKYFCKSHAKKQKYQIPTKDLKIKKLKKMKVKDLKEFCMVKQYVLPKKSKKQDYLDAICEDLSKNYFNTIETVDSRSIDIVTYGTRIKIFFEKLMLKFNIDCLIIENQIGPLALRMKMIQGMIIQHFIEVGCDNIKEISPANKLKEFINKKTTYNERKRVGIEITRKLINENEILHKWLMHFNTHKKKDDLADSFLQGRWYINTHCLK